MKKIKILAMTLVMSLMLIGSGYAAWSDTLVIGNTIETGELKLNFADDADYPKVKGAEYTKSYVKVSGDNKHTAEVVLDNLYPGSWAAFKLKGINVGTIPAKIDDIKVEFSGDEDLLPYLTYEAGFSIDKDGDNKSEGGADFSGKLSDIGKDFNKKIKAYKNMELEPNGKGNICLGQKNAKDIDNDGIKDNYIVIHFSKDAPENTQNKTLKFKLSLNFKQFNK